MNLKHVSPQWICSAEIPLTTASSPSPWPQQASFQPYGPASGTTNSVSGLLTHHIHPLNGYHQDAAGGTQFPIIRIMLHSATGLGVGLIRRDHEGSGLELSLEEGRTCYCQDCCSAPKLERNHSEGAINF